MVTKLITSACSNLSLVSRWMVTSGRILNLPTLVTFNKKELISAVSIPHHLIDYRQTSVLRQDAAAIFVSREVIATLHEI